MVSPPLEEAMVHVGGGESDSIGDAAQSPSISHENGTPDSRKGKCLWYRMDRNGKDGQRSTKGMRTITTHEFFGLSSATAQT